MKRNRLLVAVGLLALFPFTASADECDLVIEGTDQMSFSAKKMSVPASCETVKVTLKHTGSLAKNMMGHNWVLTRTDDMQAIVKAGAAAGLDNNYLPEEDDRVIAATEVIGGGESANVEFSTEGLADEKLTFFCSFPGHSGIMKGRFDIQ
ncbi:azurin [Methylophaga nitratireducenticrescens]|uniref:Azurin n=1 Tax=Methylophaga nitratireducenticrescens TaxID=754476 RepID=I1XM04_METNJ|nr:azurin [Methylophaga nitratireducenticrescens]AFI85423.1 azurin [Methylophaga nitratireducenticrescens]AUZ85181.1 azurin [Methylophaga nitratireducenticrescens]